MTDRKVMLIGAASAAALAAGVLVAPPGFGQDQAGSSVGSQAEPALVSERMRTPVGSAVKVTHAKFTHGKRRAKATVTWNKKLRTKRGNHHYTVSVIAETGETYRGAVLATWSSDSAGPRTAIRFRLGTTQTRKARAADVVQLSVTQQYDSPTDRDSKYEKNYVSTVYLKGNPPAPPTGWRDCSKVKIQPFANLSNCNLAGANLEGADLWMAALEHALLTRANLTRANLKSANLLYVNMEGANLENAKMFGIDADIEANLAHTILVGASLEHAKLSDANLTGANLGVATLNYATLVGATLIGAELGNAKMNDVNLSGAKLNKARLRETKLKYANLTGADLSGADAWSSNLTAANLTQAILTGTNLGNATLDYATWVDGHKCAPVSRGRCA